MLSFKKCKSNHIWSKTIVYLDHKSETYEAFLFYFNYAYIFRIYYKSTSNPFIWRYSSSINIWKSKLFLDLGLTHLLYCFTCGFIKTKLAINIEPTPVQCIYADPFIIFSGWLYAVRKYDPGNCIDKKSWQVW